MKIEALLVLEEEKKKLTRNIVHVVHAGQAHTHNTVHMVRATLRMRCTCNMVQAMRQKNTVHTLRECNMVCIIVYTVHKHNHTRSVCTTSCVRCERISCAPCSIAYAVCVQHPASSETLCGRSHNMVTEKHPWSAHGTRCAHNMVQGCTDNVVYAFTRTELQCACNVVYTVEIHSLHATSCTPYVCRSRRGLGRQK